MTIVYALTSWFCAHRSTSSLALRRRPAVRAAPRRRSPRRCGAGPGAHAGRFAAVGAAVMAVLGCPSRLQFPAPCSPWWSGPVAAPVGGRRPQLAGVVLGAFSMGAPISIIAAPRARRGAGARRGRLSRRVRIGQLCALALLLVRVIRVLPAEADERGGSGRPSWTTGCSRLASFAYHLSIWADKPIVWLVGGGAPRRRCYTAARRSPGSPSSRRSPGSTSRSRRCSISATARSTAGWRGARHFAAGQRAEIVSRRGAAHRAGRRAGPGRGHPGGADGGVPWCCAWPACRRTRYRCTA